MLARVEEVIQQPGAPNLYWAFGALPRPLIDMSGPMEQEERLGEDLVPELAEVDKAHTPAEWSVLLAHLHANMKRLAQMVVPTPEGLDKFSKQELAAFRKSALPQAERYLRDRRDLGEAKVREMTDDQKVALFVVGRFREIRDGLFKATHLPYQEAQRVAQKA